MCKPFTSHWGYFKTEDRLETNERVYGNVPCWEGQPKVVVSVCPVDASSPFRAYSIPRMLGLMHTRLMDSSQEEKSKIVRSSGWFLDNSCFLACLLKWVSWERRSQSSEHRDDLFVGAVVSIHEERQRFDDVGGTSQRSLLVKTRYLFQITFVELLVNLQHDAWRDDWSLGEINDCSTFPSKDLSIHKDLNKVDC